MKAKKYYILLFTAAILSACGNGRNGGNANAGQQVTDSQIVDQKPLVIKPSAPEQISATAQKLEAMGLVNIVTLDPSIAIDIVYATPDNFMGEILYEDLSEAYFLPEAADKIVRAHAALKELHPGYRFVIYDGARPMSVQRRMREAAVRTGKQYYVANPANGGGLHNYGAAVDLSILDSYGIPLSMGTEYDFLGVESNTDNEPELVRNGTITETELANRLLLRKVMTKAGFTTVQSEWWHFNHCGRAKAVAELRLIDF